MKKIFAIIFLLCGIVGDVFADCVPTEVSGGIDKDHYLFSSDPNNKKTALICARGNCDNGEIVYAKSGHYRGKNKQDKAKIYKCSRGVNDKWEVYDDSYLNTVSTVCSGNSGGGVQIFSDVNNPNGQVQGSIQDSNLITNICVKPYDEKCGVKCTHENAGKMFVCEDGGFYCDPDTLSFKTEAPIGVCDYSDPEKIKGNYEIWAATNTADSFSVWVLKEVQIENGFFTMDQACVGCSGGYYSSFSDDKTYGCVNDKDKAWCNWQKYKESKNIEWKDNECKCNDNGMQWSTEQHDCIKSGKGGKNGAGSTGSGKTGSGNGSTGQNRTCEELHPNGSAERLACCRAGKATTWTGTETSGTCSCVDKNKQWQYTAGARTGQCVAKSGAGNKTEVCGIKCNAKNSGKYFYCDNKIYWCSYDGLNGSFDLDDRYGIAGFCEYSEPAIRTGMLKTSSGNSGDNYIYEYKLDGTVLYNKITDYDGGAIYGNEKTKSLKNGGEITHSMSSGFCLGCASGFFYGSYSCHKVEDKAWCYWQKDNNLNTEWQNGECKCLDDGKVWDPKTHNCIADNGAGGTGDGKDDSLSAQEIKDAAARIDNFMKYAESNPSVWKNAEGKFNTARLASDATAGVILGTVGGIVSAHIIKKKQVEKGFDVLNCSIGGQKVADWGDEFRVGFGK